MEFAPQTPGKPQEQSPGELSVQITPSASSLTLVLRRLSATHENSENKELFFSVFDWIFVIERESKH